LSSNQQPSSPKPVVRPIDAVGLIVGIVIGAGIFRTPSLVAGNASGASTVYVAWILGGVVSLIGGLVYAELATTYPNAGGDYYYLRRAFGSRLAFLFGWSRLSVIQTGSIAGVSYIVGDYASQVVSLGKYSSAMYAAIVIALFTGLNVAGVRQGTRTQNVLTALQILGMLLVILGAFTITSPQPATASTGGNSSPEFGLMMVFVLFTYGGWNEAAYVSGELRDVHRNMTRVLVTSILLITTLYVAINWAYMHVLGFSGVAKSQLVAAEVMKLSFGPAGAQIVTVVIAVAAMTTVNGTVFTGGRSSYAFGRDFSGFGLLGRWNPRTETPLNGLVVQGAIALALVLLGVYTQKGFAAIVEYTAPVFWLFFLLTGIGFFVLRQKDAAHDRPFRVPFYPIPPILFCLTCAYLLRASLLYTGTGAVVGVAVLIIGAALSLICNPTTSNTL